MIVMDVSHENYLLPSFVHSCLQEVEHILIFLTYPHNFIDFLTEVKPNFEMFREPVRITPTEVRTVKEFANNLNCLIKNQLYYSLTPKTIFELMKNSEKLEHRSDVNKFLNLLNKENSGCTELIAKCVFEINKHLLEVHSNPIQNYRFVTGLMLFSLINDTILENNIAKINLIETYLLQHKENGVNKSDYAEIIKVISLSIILFNVCVVFYIVRYKFDLHNREIVLFEKDEIEESLENGLLPFFKLTLERLHEVGVVAKILLENPEVIQDRFFQYLINYTGNTDL